MLYPHLEVEAAKWGVQCPSVRVRSIASSAYSSSSRSFDGRPHIPFAVASERGIERCGNGMGADGFGRLLPRSLPPASPAPTKAQTLRLICSGALRNANHKLSRLSKWQRGTVPSNILQRWAQFSAALVSSFPLNVVQLIALFASLDDLDMVRLSSREPARRA